MTCINGAIVAWPWSLYYCLSSSIFTRLLKSLKKNPMAKLEYLVIHCTATREGKKITAGDIRRMHTSKPPVGRGWAQVGYADIIHQDGTVENLVPYDDDDIVQPREITNGAIGLNGKARHVSYIGGITSDGKRSKDTRTSEQANALKNYVYDFIAKYPSVKVLGHNQVAAKACPCFDVPSWLISIGINKSNIYSK
jgi:N-acetylmuramoyl-L-alanine amidase